MVKEITGQQLSESPTGGSITSGERLSCKAETQRRNRVLGTRAGLNRAEPSGIRNIPQTYY